MNSNFDLNDKNLQEEQLILCLKQEIRFQFFSPIEILAKDQEQLIQFKSQKFLFYGYKYQKLSQTKESENLFGPEPSSYIGFMVFSSGEVYIGEFNQDFKFHGEGMFVFAIGCLARGQFDVGKIHGNAVITLPNDNYIFAKFNKGSLSGETQKINFMSREVEKMQYVMGEFKENLGVFDFEDASINNMIDKMSINLIPDEIKDYKQGSQQFGSFIIDQQSIYIGFIKDGEPFGWGIMIYYSLFEYSFDSNRNFQPYEWTIKNWGCDGFQIDLQKDFVIFSNRIQEQIQGEVVVYDINNNTSFSDQIERQNLHQIVKKGNVEGVEKEAITKLFKEYLENLDIAQKDFQHDFIVSMIFNMQNFKDVLFFYLYGSLKKSVQKYFADNMKIFDVLRMTHNDQNEEHNSLTDQQNESQKTIQSKKNIRENDFDSLNSFSMQNEQNRNKKIIQDNDNLSNDSQILQPKNFSKKQNELQIDHQDNDIYRNPFETSEQNINNMMKRNSSKMSKFSNQLRYIYDGHDSSMENNIMRLEQIQSSQENRPNTAFQKDLEQLQMVQRPKTSSYNKTKGLVENLPKRKIQNFSKRNSQQNIIEESQNQSKDSQRQTRKFKSTNNTQENVLLQYKNKLQLIFTKNEMCQIFRENPDLKTLLDRNQKFFIIINNKFITLQIYA